MNNEELNNGMIDNEKEEEKEVKNQMQQIMPEEK